MTSDTGTTIFVTGATGNVGQAVVPVLLDEGLNITTLLRKPSEIKGCHPLFGCLEDVSSRLAPEIARCSAIVHLACSRSLNPSEVLRQDIAGTAGLIQVWRNGPFLYASSSRVYGNSTGTLTEQTPVSFLNSYDRGKYANEFQLRLAERRDGRAGALILRPTLIFAVNDRIDDRHLLGAVFAHCKRGGRFVFASEEELATGGCSFIGGTDFGRVIAKALSQGLSGTLNIAGGFCTWRELIETMNRLTGTKGDLVVRADTKPQAGEFRFRRSVRRLDTTALASVMDFKPRETLQEIIEALVRAKRGTKSRWDREGASLVS